MNGHGSVSVTMSASELPETVMEFNAAGFSRVCVIGEAGIKVVNL